MKYEWPVRKELAVTDEDIITMASEMRHYLKFYDVEVAAWNTVIDVLAGADEIDEDVPEYIIKEITELVIQKYYTLKIEQEE